MRVLFDQGTPEPLRHVLTRHEVATAYERGWSDLDNGNLLRAAEEEIDLLITTDPSLRYQQNLSGRRLAILVLPSTSWPEIRQHVERVRQAIQEMRSGDYRQIQWTS